MTDERDVRPDSGEKIYSATPTSADETSALRAFRYRSFHCPRCRTDISVTREQVGTTVVCPDCDTEIVVPDYLDFETETDYERQFYNENKKERDALFSPLRNPNREGIDVDGADAYRLADPNDSAADVARRERARAESGAFLAVRCRVCETLMQYPREMLGKTVRCPDCGTETVVTDALSRQQAATDVKFQPRDRGTYGLGEIPAAPSTVVVQRKDGRLVQVDLTNKTVAPGTTLRDAFAKSQAAKADESLKSELPNEAAQGAAEAEKSASDENDNDNVKTDATGKVRRREKGNGDIWGAWRRFCRRRREKRAARRERDPKEFALPLVLRRKNGELVWAHPSPPKRSPLFNRTFRAAKSEEIWARGGIVVLAAVAVSVFMLFVAIPMAAEVERDAVGVHPLKGFGTLVSTMAAWPIFAFGAVFWAELAIGIFSAGNSGAKRAVEWRDDDFWGSIGFAIWFWLVVAASFLPGIALVSTLGLSNGEGVWAVWAETAESSGIGWRAALGFAGSFWLFHPIFFLATMQTNWFFAPISGALLSSFLRRCVIWAEFYAASALVALIPLTLLVRFAETNVVWFVAPVAIVPLTTLYELLLGRLSWILDDDQRSLDFDD